MRFIATAQVELPRPQGRLNIGVAEEAARRVELTAQYIGAQGSGVTAHLFHLVMKVMSDRRMPESVKPLLAWCDHGRRLEEFAELVIGICLSMNTGGKPH